ncbi:hypothetical protein RFI_12483 [Reticulomyxa filosa]|uniref:Uncharacterized protein n=1 Tax=Reticulomyxa filosa TaxID=46433 RepID=X6NEC0_RETFI|nr:hypothetical protein RFI_12483 [Reticulomyxa filosa]|eukprot:ETO24675.1 hypothetical protein RFI_12483 [Reticulomyxa filosa]
MITPKETEDNEINFQKMVISKGAHAAITEIGPIKTEIGHVTIQGGTKSVKGMETKTEVTECREVETKITIVDNHSRGVNEIITTNEEAEMQCISLIQGRIVDQSDIAIKEMDDKRYDPFVVAFLKEEFAADKTNNVESEKKVLPQQVPIHNMLIFFFDLYLVFVVDFEFEEII